MDTTKYKASIEVLSNPENLAQQCVNIFISEAQKAVSEKGVFYVAISGGHTPKHFFELLGKLVESHGRESVLTWDKIQLFWVDERYVPSDSPQSNYKLAKDTFLNKVPIPEENVHRIPTEYSDFKNAAKKYEEIIKNVFKLEQGQKPVFDLIVLGMGPDGHTGSLFPNSYATFDTDDLACVVYVMDEKLNRITLTHPVLCAAQRLVVLVSGKEKAAILKEVMTSEPDEVRYPIHTIWPVLDKVTWLIDKDAASDL